ncbi:hypothetical protein EVAR_45072_1 [Eumeta japonica]|uniref:Uncharacterized protein n=1 Tax=Eumeta variegata TaxID=151549 RepID=A0A4C1XUM2_EUMVA|nr:hypothetical protein EVAR_45072_1 [Eumeta japonica]
MSPDKTCPLRFYFLRIANRGNDMPCHMDSGGKKQQLRTRRRDSSEDILHESICPAVPPIPALCARLRIKPLLSFRRP